MKIFKLLFLVGISSTVICMEKSPAPLLQVMKECLNHDPLGKTISPHLWSVIEEFYQKNNFVAINPDFGALVERFAKDITLYLFGVAKDSELRAHLIHIFIRPFLTTKTPLHSFIYNLDGEIPIKTFLNLLSEFGKHIAACSDTSYLAHCLHVVLCAKKVRQVAKLLALGCCTITPKDLMPEAAWADDLIQFYNAPHITSLFAKKLPRMANLFIAFIGHPELELSKNYELCEYIANPSLFETILRRFKNAAYPEPSENGQTWLIWFCVFGDTLKVVELLETGLPISYITYLDHHDKSALVYAAEHGHKSIVELLLNAGAQPTVKALLGAADNKHGDIVTLLSHRRNY